MNQESRPSRAGNRLLKGTSAQFFTLGANFFSGFLMMPFLIHHLGERGYGFWALIGTIVGQLGILDAGLMSTTERFLANALAQKDYAAGAKIFSTSMAIFWGLGGLAFLVVAGIAFSAPLWLSSKQEIHNFEIALLISGINLAMLFPFAILQGALAARLRSDAAMVGQISSTLLRLVLTVTVVEFGYGIIAVSIANVLGSLVMRINLLAMMRKYIPEITYSNASVDWKVARELFSFGKFVFLVNAADTAKYRLHNIIIAAFGSIALVTHYSVAIRLADYFQEILSRLATVTGPIYAKHFTLGEDEILGQRFLTISRLGTIICCVFVSATFVFGHTFIHLWLGNGFEDSSTALMILVGGMFFALVQSSSRYVLRAIYRHAFDAGTNLLEVVINLVLALLLVPRFGIVGAAIATAIPMIIIKGVVLPIYVCRQLRLATYVYYETLMPFVLVSGCSAAILLLTPLRNIDSLLLLAVAGVAYALFLGLVLALFLPQSDKLHIVNAIGPESIARIPGGEWILATLTGERE